MGKRIYAADDDPRILQILGLFLGDAGFEASLFESGDLLLAAFQNKPCDLVILDVMMPGSDGIAICAKIREQSQVPIIILTAKDSELDHAVGFSSGGDDYIIKPFRPSLLMMKIKALLRRADMVKGSRENTDLSLGDLRYLDDQKQVFCEGQLLHFTMTELKLLTFMMAQAGKALSRDELLQAIWGFDEQVETRVTDETVRRLRNKLASAGSKVSIKTIWGYGYKMVEGHDVHD